MNKRQKKKRYKKLYGTNPLKGTDGRYLYQMKREIKKRELPVVTTARILARRRKK